MALNDLENLNTAFDLVKLYKTYFLNSPYSIATENPRPKGSIDYSAKNIAFNKKGAYGQDIWFPVTLKSTERTPGKFENLEIEIEACTVGVNLSKTIIRTAVSERKGTVKECFAIDDYRFVIRGFLIGKDRLVPEYQINTLIRIFENTEPVEMHGGYVEMFLEKSCQVAIMSLDFPEVQGKAVWIRPFAMTLETDYIDTLIEK